MSDTTALDHIVTDALDTISSRKAIKHILKAQHAEEKARKKADKRLRKKLAKTDLGVAVHDYRVVACDANGKPVDALPPFKLDGSADVVHELHVCLAQLMHSLARGVYINGHLPAIFNEAVTGEDCAALQHLASPQSLAHLLEACSQRHYELANYYSAKMAPDPQPEPQAG